MQNSCSEDSFDGLFDDSLGDFKLKVKVQGLEEPFHVDCEALVQETFDDLFDDFEAYFRQSVQGSGVQE